MKRLFLALILFAIAFVGYMAQQEGRRSDTRAGAVRETAIEAPAPQARSIGFEVLPVSPGDSVEIETAYYIDDDWETAAGNHKERVSFGNAAAAATGGTRAGVINADRNAPAARTATQAPESPNNRFSGLGTDNYARARI